MSIETISSITGVIGAFLYLLSYAILQLQRNFAKTLTYTLMNLFAACAVMFSIFYQWNLASAIIQTSWILISLYGLGRCLEYSRPYRLDPRPAKRTFLFLKRNLPDSVEILPRDQKAEK